MRLARICALMHVSHGMHRALLQRVSVKYGLLRRQQRNLLWNCYAHARTAIMRVNDHACKGGAAARADSLGALANRAHVRNIQRRPMVAWKCA